MTTANLAKIERVSDLRATWPNEAQHFTPWLAENIAELGEALGMDLELQQIEAPVGGYSLDILATDLNSNRPVIIENQLEVTNHGHLGQLLTYAAGFDAEAVVWVTREFRDEHRQALDWLNQRTGEDTQFFGVEVELWRIGESPLAPHFRMVVSPNDWRRTSVRPSETRSTGQVSERMERYRDFFQSLIDMLREEHRFTNARQSQPNSWRHFSSGFAGINYGASFILGSRATVQVNLDRSDSDWNRSILLQLEERKEEIESRLGSALDWEQSEGRRVCRISIYRFGTIDDQAEALQQMQDWMVNNLLKFKEVFTPYLEELVN